MYSDDPILDIHLVQCHIHDCVLNSWFLIYLSLLFHQVPCSFTILGLVLDDNIITSIERSHFCIIFHVDLVKTYIIYVAVFQIRCQ